MRIKVTLAYDGSHYAGWGIQDNAHTVQEEIETVLSKITKQNVRVHASGRTDADVHARAQVFHFDTLLDMPEDAWKRAMNALTDDAIHIGKVEIVDESFHARFSARSKIYSYHLNMGEKNVFKRKYEYQLGKSLDIEAMKQAMKLVVGTHDFTSFNSTELKIIPNQVRTLYAFDIEVNDDKVTFTIHGNGFLRHMVRRLVGSVVAVGLHTITVEDFKHAFEAKDKAVSRYNIDGCGLYLECVKY